jgi:hypothetical protein
MLVTRINRTLHDKELSERGYGVKTRNVKVDIKYEHHIYYYQWPYSLMHAPSSL